MLTNEGVRQLAAARSIEHRWGRQMPMPGLAKPLYALIWEFVYDPLALMIFE